MKAIEKEFHRLLEAGLRPMLAVQRSKRVQPLAKFKDGYDPEAFVWVAAGRSWRGVDVGVFCKGLVDIDCDSPEAYRTADEACHGFLDNPYRQRGRKTSHSIVYRVPDWFDDGVTLANDDSIKLEFKHGPTEFTFVPPSICRHTGKPYEVLPGKDLVDTPTASNATLVAICRLGNAAANARQKMESDRAALRRRRTFRVVTNDLTADVEWIRTHGAYVLPQLSGKHCRPVLRGNDTAIRCPSPHHDNANNLELCWVNDDGRVNCWKCGLHGDVFSVAGQLLGIDPRNEFVRLVREIMRQCAVAA